METEHDLQNKKYINTKVHPIFEKLIMDLLLEKPDNVVEYMKKWLDHYGSEVKMPIEDQQDL